MCSKLTIKTLLPLLLTLLTYFTSFSSVFIVDFENVIAGWVGMEIFWGLKTLSRNKTFGFRFSK